MSSGETGARIASCEKRTWSSSTERNARSSTKARDAFMECRSAAVGDHEDGSPPVRRLGDSAQVSVEQMVERGGRVFVVLAREGVDDLSQC